MSEDVTKTALRLQLPKLTGKNWTEAWEIIRPILGDKDKCRNFDSNKDGEVLWFEYPNYRFHQRGEEWYVDHILCYDRAYEHPCFTMRFVSLVDLLAEEANRFGVKKSDVNIVVVTWYNGTDEPFEFDFGEGPIAQ